jgi:hypothetical protein
MKRRVYLIAPLVMICTLAWPVGAQQPDRPSQEYKLRLALFRDTGQVPLATEQPEPSPIGAGEEPFVVLQTYATPLEAGVKPVYRLSPKQLWQKATFFSQLSLAQHQRFLATGQPMMIDQDGVYFWRDLYSYTKGIMLASFFDNKVDVGLYKRRYVSPETYLTGAPLFDYGAERPGEGPLFSGGRQIFVGVRLDLNKLFKKR